MDKLAIIYTEIMPDEWLVMCPQHSEFEISFSFQLDKDLDQEKIRETIYEKITNLMFKKYHNLNSWRIASETFNYFGE